MELEVTLDESESSKSDSPPENTGSNAGDDDTDLLVDDVPRQPHDREAGPVVDYSPILPLGNVPGTGWGHPFIPYPEEKFMPAILSHCMFDLVDLCF